MSIIIIIIIVIIIIIIIITFNTENHFVSEQNKKPTLQAEAYLSHS